MKPTINDLIGKQENLIDLRSVPFQKNKCVNFLKEIRSRFDSVYLLGRAVAFDRSLVEVSVCRVSDHINLSSLNPIIGDSGLYFFAINDMYTTTDRLLGLRSVKVVGVNPPTHPTKQETEQLMNAGVDWFSHDFVCGALLCGYFNMSVIGLVELL